MSPDRPADGRKGDQQGDQPGDHEAGERALVRELRDHDDAESWLAAGLSLARLVRPGADELVRIAPWLHGALAESGELPPAGIIADIGHIVTGRSLRVVAPLPDAGAALRDAVSSYEDHVLGRLEADPRIDAIIDAVVRLPAQRRDDAVALFCVHLLARIGFDAGVSIGPGIARRVLYMPTEDIASRGHEALTEADLIHDMLIVGYRRMTTAARRIGTLVSEPEVFLMENFEALGELTHRLAIEQMIEVAEALSEALPRRLKPRPRADVGRIPTPLAAEDNYPTGGFSSLSTSGSMENLVISELIYMDDVPQGDGDDEHPRDAIDLFDLRYAEGELLYYTRDESVFVRNRRTIQFILMPDLAGLRFKDAEMRWQRLVVAFGAIACAIRRLATWLEGEGLSFRAVFVSDPDLVVANAEPLAGERGLCAILLREWIAKEMAEVTIEPSLDAVLARAADEVRVAEIDAIVFSARPIEVDREEIPGVVLGNLVMGEPAPVLRWPQRPEATTAPGIARDTPGGDEEDERRVELWRAWTRVTLEMLQEIL